MFINQAKEGLCNICLHILAKRWIKCFVIWLDPSFPLGFAGFPHTGLFHRNWDLRASLSGITVTIYKIPRSRYPGYQSFFSRATGTFVSSAASRHVFGQRPKTRTAKPREKILDDLV